MARNGLIGLYPQFVFPNKGEVIEIGNELFVNDRVELDAKYLRITPKVEPTSRYKVFIAGKEISTRYTDKKGAKILKVAPKRMIENDILKKFSMEETEESKEVHYRSLQEYCEALREKEKGKLVHVLQCDAGPLKLFGKITSINSRNSATSSTAFSSDLYFCSPKINEGKFLKSLFPDKEFYELGLQITPELAVMLIWMKNKLR